MINPTINFYTFVYPVEGAVFMLHHKDVAD